MSRESILEEIGRERERQNQLFGGDEHDSQHSATDWVGILVRHLGLALDDGKPADVCLMNDHCAGHDPQRYRRQLIRVAAVAVAAVEMLDMKSEGKYRPLPDALEALRERAGDLIDRGQELADRYGQPVYLTDTSYDVLGRANATAIGLVPHEFADKQTHKQGNHLWKWEPRNATADRQ